MYSQIPTGADGVPHMSQETFHTILIKGLKPRPEFSGLANKSLRLLLPQHQCRLGPSATTCTDAPDSYCLSTNADLAPVPQPALMPQTPTASAQCRLGPSATTCLNSPTHYMAPDSYCLSTNADLAPGAEQPTCLISPNAILDCFNTRVYTLHNYSSTTPSPHR
eukprot:gene25813-11488_t